jgi:hypothetical protein
MRLVSAMMLTLSLLALAGLIGCGRWLVGAHTNECASPLVRSVRSLLGVAPVLLRRSVMSGRPRAKAQRRRSRDRNNWKRRYVSTMSVMGGRWAAVGNNRLTNFWRVVLHISDAMYAGASKRVLCIEDDRAKVAEEEARVKELQARSRAGKERLVRILEQGAIPEWQGTADGDIPAERQRPREETKTNALSAAPVLAASPEPRRCGSIASGLAPRSTTHPAVHCPHMHPGLCSSAATRV